MPESQMPLIFGFGLLYIIIVVLLTALAAWIFALVFQAKKSRWYQQKQMDLLIAMASKAGVSDEELNEIISREVK